MGGCLSKGATAYLQHKANKPKKPKFFSAFGGLFDDYGEEGQYEGGEYEGGEYDGGDYGGGFDFGDFGGDFGGE